MRQLTSGDLPAGVTTTAKSLPNGGRIYTLHWETDATLIWRVDGLGSKWTEEENTILRQHYPTDDRASILTRLPHRSWHAITFQANQLKLCRSTQMKNNSPVLEFITLLDWQFMQEEGLVYDKNWQRREVMWLESGKTKGSIFPLSNSIEPAFLVVLRKLVEKEVQ